MNFNQFFNCPQSTSSKTESQVSEPEEQGSDGVDHSETTDGQQSDSDVTYFIIVLIIILILLSCIVGLIAWNKNTKNEAKPSVQSNSGPAAVPVHQSTKNDNKPNPNESLAPVGTDPKKDDSDTVVSVRSDL